MTKKLKSLHKKIRKRISSLESTASELQSAANDVKTSAKKLKPVSVTISGLVAAYMKAVAKTDGLTSVRPATLKAVQTAEKRPSEASVLAAIGQLKKHEKDLKKTAKGDPKYRKFKKHVGSISGQLQAML